MKIIKIVTVIIGSTFLINCQKVQVSYHDLYIKHYKSQCYMTIEGLCHRVSDTAEGEERNFSNSVEGLDYSWGTSYHVKVKVTKLSNPPADSNGKEYQLEKIYSQDIQPIGSEFILKNITMRETTIGFEDNQYKFIHKPFTCGEGVDCDALENLNGTGGEVNLTFKHLGSGDIELAQWE